MKTVKEVCQFIGKTAHPFPVCVETGCSYTCGPGNEIHTTTNNLVEFVAKPNQGRLISFDIDPEHIKFAKDFTAYLDFEVEFVCGDSVVQMVDYFRESSLVIDVLCLDSKEFDEDHMVNEYNAVKGFLRPEKHFVLVDDIHNPNSVKYKKMVPILKNKGYEYREVATPTGLFVASQGYSLW